MLKKREYIDSFVDRSIDRKLTEILKNVVKLENKTATQMCIRDRMKPMRH